MREKKKGFIIATFVLITIFIVGAYYCIKKSNNTSNKSSSNLNNKSDDKNSKNNGSKVDNGSSKDKLGDGKENHGEEQNKNLNKDNKNDKVDTSKSSGNGSSKEIKNEFNLKIYVKSAVVGSQVRLDIDKKYIEKYNIESFQVLKDNKLISKIYPILEATVIYPPEEPGSAVDVKLYDKNKKELKLIKVTLLEDKGN